MNYREKYFAENKSDHSWYTCAMCGKKIRKCDADVDHIIPQKHGGADELYNLQCLCKHCNRSKQAKLKGVPTNLIKHNVKRVGKKIVESITTKLKPVSKPKSKVAKIKTAVSKNTATKTKTNSIKTTATKSKSKKLNT